MRSTRRGLPLIVERWWAGIWSAMVLTHLKGENMETATIKEMCACVTLRIELGVRKPFDKQDDWQRAARGYRCTLGYMGRSYSFDYWMGTGCSTGPTAQRCLESLLSDAALGQDDFQNFCANLGLSEDSRKAERLWKACDRVNTRMKTLLGSEYERFMAAEV